MHFEYRTSFLYELGPSTTIRTLALETAGFHSHDQIFTPTVRQNKPRERKLSSPNGHDDTWVSIPEFVYFRKSYFISAQLRYRIRRLDP